MPKKYYQPIIVTLLMLSFGIIISLLSGHSIDVRNISIEEKMLLKTYYSLLVLLTLLSIVTILFILENKMWGYFISALCGVAYFLIYALDLLTIFPHEFSILPKTIFILEATGFLVSIPTIILSIYAFISHNKEDDTVVYE